MIHPQHTLWVRQHNRLAKALSTLNPHWNDEQTFQEARRIVGSQMQHITYQEYLPIILGKETNDKYKLGPQRMGFFTGYDINTNPGTANAVASGAFKFVASLLPSLLQYYEQSGTKVPYYNTNTNYSAYRMHTSPEEDAG